MRDSADMISRCFSPEAAQVADNTMKSTEVSEVSAGTLAPALSFYPALSFLP